MRIIRNCLRLFCATIFLLGIAAVGFRYTTFPNIFLIWGGAIIVLICDAAQSFFPKSLVSKFTYFVAIVGLIYSAGRWSWEFLQEYRPYTARLLEEKSKANDLEFYQTNKPATDPIFSEMFEKHLERLTSIQKKEINKKLLDLENKKANGMPEEEFQKEREKVALTAHQMNEDNRTTNDLLHNGKKMAEPPPKPREQPLKITPKFPPAIDAPPVVQKPEAAPISSPEPVEKTEGIIYLPDNYGVKSTSFEVSGGKEYIFCADGILHWSDSSLEPQKDVGPIGSNWPAGEGYPFPEANFLALVATIEDRPEVVGKCLHHYFAGNDSVKFVLNFRENFRKPQGKFRITIRSKEEKED